MRGKVISIKYLGPGRLRERFAVLRPIAENEPGLVLNFSPEPEPVPEPAALEPVAA
jgi:hypothetical protein